MVELAKVILPIIQRFKNIVGYGGSMGGYAAIKYSNLLNMNRIIAFVPQYSIDLNKLKTDAMLSSSMLSRIKTCKFSRKM